MGNSAPMASRSVSRSTLTGTGRPVRASRFTVTERVSANAAAQSASAAMATTVLLMHFLLGTGRAGLYPAPARWFGRGSSIEAADDVAGPLRSAAQALLRRPHPLHYRRLVLAAYGAVDLDEVRRVVH